MLIPQTRGAAGELETKRKMDALETSWRSFAGAFGLPLEAHLNLRMRKEVLGFGSCSRTGATHGFDEDPDSVFPHGIEAAANRD